MLWFCGGIVLLPIPLGMFWVWVYRNRRDLDLPDWFAGILAQGIISGHKINQGDAEDDDYTFIVIATLISVFLVVVLLYLTVGFCRLITGT